MLKSNQSSDVAGKEGQKSSGDARSRGPQSVSARLQSAELANAASGYEDKEELNAIVAMLMGPRPDGAALADAIERCTPAELSPVAESSTLMSALVAACTEAQLARALPHVFTDPMWSIYYYVTEKGAEDLSTIQSFLSQASNTQRQGILEWRGLGDRLEALFGELDPSVLFGVEMVQSVASGPTAAACSAPWFALWCLRHARGDVEVWLEAVATSPETLALATANGGADWTTILADCPRGEALGERAQASLDRIALEFPDALPLEALLDAFEIRFDQDLRAIAAVEGGGLDRDGVQTVWRALAQLPADGVTVDVVRWHVPGDQFDADLVERLGPDEGDEDTPPEAPPQQTGKSDAGPAHWRRFDAVQLAIEAFVEHAGGDEALSEAATQFLLGGGGQALMHWRDAVREADARGALAANAAQVEIALIRLRDALPQEWTLGSTSAEGADGRPDLSAPAAFAGWTEYFAAVVTRSGAAGTSDPRPRHLPRWVTGAQASGLVEED